MQARTPETMDAKTAVTLPPGELMTAAGGMTAAGLVRCAYRAGVAPSELLARLIEDRAGIGA